MFVTFDRNEDAKEAISKSAGTEFFGRKLYVDWSGRNEKEFNKPFRKDWERGSDRERDGDKRSAKAYDRGDSYTKGS